MFIPIVSYGLFFFLHFSASDFLAYEYRRHECHPGGGFFLLFATYSLCVDGQCDEFGPSMAADRWMDQTSLLSDEEVASMTIPAIIVPELNPSLE